MNYPKNLTLTALKTGLVITLALGSSAMAAECLSLQLINSRNTGVSIDNNSCNDNQLALGSKLKLAAGSRLWLQFDAGDNFELIDTQVICQNKMSMPVTVNLNNTESPWINPDTAHIKCNTWSNNRISCDGHHGEKNAFFCAVAEARQANSSSAIALGTSVTMRSIDMSQKIISNVEDEIQLCKNLYGIDRKIAISWTVTATGAIKNLALDNSNQGLSQCIEKVITGVNYGKPETPARAATEYLPAREYQPAQPAQEVTISNTLF